MKKKKILKLRTNLLMIIIFSWLLPFVFLVLFTLTYTYREISLKTENSIVFSMSGAVDTSTIHMQNCVTASKTASYLPTIKNIYDTYQEEKSLVVLYEDTNKFLDQQYKFDKRFVLAAIYYPEISEKTYYSYNIQAGGRYNIVQFYEENIKDEIIEVAKDLGTRTSFVNKEGQIFLVRNIMKSSYEPCAVIVMQINQDMIYESMQSVWGYEKGVIYEDGKLLFGDKNIKYNQKMKASTNNAIPVFEKKERLVWKTVKEEGREFTYIIKLDEESILYQTSFLIKIIVLAFLFIGLLAFIVFNFFRKKVSKPVEELVTSAREIGKGNYGYNVSTNITVEEFVYLEDAFNDMSNELKNQFEKLYLEELALRDAEIMALQSQINPHFLNNTLEIINWEARMEKNYKVSGMIEALSTILGATMNRDKRKLVSLLEEMSYVDSYLYIISTRLGERIHVKKEIDETLMQEKVPKLIIQPIIENAVEHGINSQNRGEITIRIYAEEEILYIEIINNGKLSELDRIKIDNLLSDVVNENETGATRLGIRNVHKRLQILYGKTFGLSIKSDKEGRTSSKIMVKIDKKC